MGDPDKVQLLMSGSCQLHALSFLCTLNLTMAAQNKETSSRDVGNALVRLYLTTLRIPLLSARPLHDPLQHFRQGQSSHLPSARFQLLSSTLIGNSAGINVASRHALCCPLSEIACLCCWMPQLALLLTLTVILRLHQP